MADFSYPAAPPQTPGFPSNPTPVVFEGFDGINTKPLRPGITDRQMYWCDGFMPVGESYLRTIPGVGSSIFTRTSSNTIKWFGFGNIGFSQYCYVLQSDGSVTQVNLANNATTPVLSVSTVTAPNSTFGFSQWGNQYILLSNNQTNGYWIWDGSISYSSGTVGPVPDILDSGAGYASAPTIIPYGGSGSGATFAASVLGGAITSITVTSAGSGYTAYDVPILTFLGGGNPNITATLSFTIANGTPTSISVSSAGVGYTQGVTVSPTGGGSGLSVALSTPRGVLTGSISAVGTGYSNGVQGVTGGTGGSAQFGLTTTSGSITSISVAVAGNGYTDGDVLTVSGGTGGHITVDSIGGSITSISVVASGTGYTAGGTLAVPGVPTGSGGVLTVSQTDNGALLGSLTSASIANPGAGYTSSVSSIILGGGGTSGAVALTVAGGSISSVSITNAGSGYLVSPTALIQDTNNSVAVAIMPTMPFGVSGTTIETFAGRVWIGNVTVGQFSAPDSPSDFTTSDAAGAFKSTDSFLKTNFQSFKQTNGFLYLIADSSMNYISGVQVSGNPAETSFNNQNVDPQIGTAWPASVQLFSRNIVFGNYTGVFVSYGGAVTKISNELDGVYGTSSRLTSFGDSSAIATLYNQQVYILLHPILDPVTGLDVNKLLMWDGKKWWASQQDIADLTFINSREQNSLFTAYATEGTEIYPMFQETSSGFTKYVVSKLWSNPSYLFFKTQTRFLGIVNYFDVTDMPAINYTLDTENGPSPTAQVQFSPGIQSGLNTWVNSVGQNGVLIGLTLWTNCSDLALVSTAIVNQTFQTRL